MINAPKEPSIPEWLQFIETTFADEHQAFAREYVSKLIGGGARVIFDIVHLSRLTGFAVSALNAMVNNAPSFYRRFDIPKRSGGVDMTSAVKQKLSLIERVFASS